MGARDVAKTRHNYDKCESPGNRNGQRVEGAPATGSANVAPIAVLIMASTRTKVPISSAVNERTASSPILCPCRPEATRTLLSRLVTNRFDAVSVTIPCFRCGATIRSAKSTAFSFADSLRQPKRRFVAKRTVDETSFPPIHNRLCPCSRSLHYRDGMPTSVGGVYAHAFDDLGIDDLGIDDLQVGACTGDPLDRLYDARHVVFFGDHLKPPP